MIPPRLLSFLPAMSVPNHEVRIVDDAGNEVPDRTEGFLWFRGPSATSGYFNNPQRQPKNFFLRAQQLTTNFRG